MSDLDEHEEQAEAMLADLEAADAVPESVKLANRLAAEHIARHGLGPTIISDAILRK
jgi:hypothetical protein